MITDEKKIITVEVKLHLPIDKIWEYWTRPQHILEWNTASADWHTPRAENDVRVDGSFNWRMEAKDGSEGFDFKGIYTEVKTFKKIAYEIEGGRKVTVLFENNGVETKITESFEAESENSFKEQQSGRQTILDNFKRYAESVNEYQ